MKKERMNRLLSLIVAAAVSVLTWVAPAQADLRLMMVEQAGCAYCARWEKEIGPIYEKTSEGQAAPILKVDLRADLPAGITLTGGKPRYTPTFVLLRDGVEQSRIEGYPGEDFFWGLLDKMLTHSNLTASQVELKPTG